MTEMLALSRVSRLSSRSIASACSSPIFWPSSSGLIEAESSSKRRTQAPLETGDRSVSSRSSTSLRLWGRYLRASSTVCL